MPTTHDSKAEERDRESQAITPHDDGVDASLIRWMLTLSPAERLAVLHGNLRSILRLRDAKPKT